LIGAALKRKNGARDPWPRILERRYEQMDLETPEFTGVVTRLEMMYVRQPLWITSLGQGVCIADVGFVWMHHVPENANHVVTSMFNVHGDLVQHYIDIIWCWDRAANGVPWFDDLYLDVVVSPMGAVELLDEDELEDAFRVGSITLDQHDLAHTEAQAVLETIRSGGFSLLERITSRRLLEQYP
jgi:uncharacterized protein